MTLSRPLPRTLSALRSAGIFLAAGTVSLAAALAAYVIAVDSVVPDPALPTTYKWFLLAETPGERIIIESGCNSHHGVDAGLMSELTGRTTINIADNGGYDLADKVSRLERHARAGDVLVLPLEWSYFTRDSLTEDYFAALLREQAGYYNALDTRRRIGRALSLPPAMLATALTSGAPDLPSLNTVYLESLMAPHGSMSFETSRGPGAGVAEQTCDAYLQGALDGRRLAPRFLSSLDRLADLREQGIDVYFAWPAMVGDACFTDADALRDLQADVEAALAERDIALLNTVSDSIFPADAQDDTPYHLTAAAAQDRTRQLSAALLAAGVSGTGETVNLSRFARFRLYEMERAALTDQDHEPMMPGQTVRPGEPEAAAPYLGLVAGWWDAEAYGRWMRADRAALQVALPADLPPEAVLRLDTRTLEGNTLRLSAAIGGRTLARSEVGVGQPFDIPVGALPAGDTLIDLALELTSEPTSPAQLGRNADRRTLTLHLQGVSLLPGPGGAPAPVVAQAPTPQMTPPEERPQVATVSAPRDAGPALDGFLGTPAGLGTGDGASFCLASGNVVDLVRLDEAPVPGTLNYGEGWWPAERDGRWAGAREVSVSLPRPRSRQGQLILLATPFSSGDLRAEVVIGGGEAQTILLNADTPVRLPVPEDALARERIDVVIRFPDAPLMSPAELGLSEDPRTLVAFFRTIALTS